MIASEIRWGVMGFGKIAQRAMIPALDRAEHAKLCAVGRRAPQETEGLKAASKSCPQARLETYEDLLAGDDIDAVYLALPNHLHFEWAKKCLLAGKSVLCEKPLVMVVDQARELRDLAQAKGLCCAEAFMYRHHPQVERVLECLRDGSIGELRLIRASFTYLLSDLSNIRLKPDCGGGALWDVGCYGVNASRYILNEEPKEVLVNSVFGSQSGVDERCAMQLSFASGVQAQIFAATDAWRENQVELLGTKGRLELPCAFVSPAGKRSMVILKNEQGQQVFKIDPVDQYQLQVEAFQRSMQQGVLEGPLEDGVAQAEVMELLAKLSAESSS